MQLTRRLFGRAGFLALAAAPAFAAGAARADAPRHRLAIHIGDGEEAKMKLALANIANAADYYAGKGEDIAIELVANGPGFSMLRDNSPVKDQIAGIAKKYPSVVFSACQHSRAGVAKKEGKKLEEIGELPQATNVEAGVARLTDLQQLGWGYVRV